MMGAHDHPALPHRRRLATDWEKTNASTTAFLLVAHIRRLTRRIASRCNA
jgi:hypothetical protein